MKNLIPVAMLVLLTGCNTAPQRHPVENLSACWAKAEAWVNKNMSLLPAYKREGFIEQMAWECVDPLGTMRPGGY